MAKFKIARRWFNDGLQLPNIDNAFCCHSTFNSHQLLVSGDKADVERRIKDAAWRSPPQRSFGVRKNGKNQVPLP
ncbi:hypothetical protein AB1N83_010962 [Pleurotus pulmonarius]